eukprot:2446800-Pyramimonas_sp.AAC.1
MRIESPPSERNVLLGCLICTVSVAPFVIFGGFPRIWDGFPASFWHSAFLRPYVPDRYIGNMTRPGR